MKKHPAITEKLYRMFFLFILIPLTFSGCQSKETQNNIPVVTRGPYLQIVTQNQATIRWRTDIAVDSKILYGTSLNYSDSAFTSSVDTEHIVTINNLSPNSIFYYAIGTTGFIIQGDSTFKFITAPDSNEVTPVRIWATGDFGNGSQAQKNVRDAYMSFPGSEKTNLWLWLGDNAYASGTDSEYQANVFNIYADQLKQFPLFPAIGNHDYANCGYQSSLAHTDSFPYFNIFSLPQNGEAGGVASGTPKYYSFNYSNIHLIALDSYGVANDSSSGMHLWLQQDLSLNRKPWIIVYFHHPPYSKGTHNSDTEIELINMRVNIIPLLEQNHVDLVLCGHSHINERSLPLKGYYGTSESFSQTMIKSNGTNHFSMMAPYNGTVYAVCGTSGQTPGTTQPGYPLMCMPYSDAVNNCSMVIDLSGDHLNAKYLTSTGAIANEFSIHHLSRQGENPLELFSYNDQHDTWISYVLDNNSTLNFELFSSDGKSLGKLQDISSRQAPGYYRVKLPIEKLHLAKGTYLLRVTLNETVFTKKIQVIY